MVLDALKKTLLASLGVVAFTRDKLQAIVKDLVDRGELTSEQGRKLLEELVERGRRENEEISDLLAREMQHVLERLPFVSRTEFDALAERVRKLEASEG